MTETQTPITIPMTLTPKSRAYDQFGHQWESAVDLVGRFRHQGLGRDCRFKLVYLDETTSSRREYMGPIIAGEYAYLVPLATVIASTPTEHVETVRVADGDLIEILGRTFRIADDKALHDPRIVRVEN